LPNLLGQKPRKYKKVVSTEQTYQEPIDAPGSVPNFKPKSKVDGQLPRIDSSYLDDPQTTRQMRNQTSAPELKEFFKTNKPQQKPEIKKDDVILINKHDLVRIMKLDLQGESIYNIETELEESPKDIKIRELSEIDREKKMNRDYILLDTRDREDYDLLHVADCTLGTLTQQFPIR
jgi:hypothetical protein